MKRFFILVVHLLVILARLIGSGGARSMVAENRLLKQQLLVLSRTRQRAPHLSVIDRFLFGGWSLFLKPRRLLRAAILPRPSTLLQFHAALVKRQYQRLFTPRTRAKPGPLSSDNDPLFLYHPWQANLRILDIEKIKTIPYLPLSHPFVERLIGTIRHEFLDPVFFWSAIDLQQKLDTFQQYYHTDRVHRSRDGQPPVIKLENHASLTNIQWQRCCRGLYQLPIGA
jgi:hypothetical protein